jgi:hypothetical protein
MPLLYLVFALIAVGVIAWLVNTSVPVPPSVKGIINIILALIVVGMALWLINTYVPMAGSIKAILNIVVVVATCVRILQAVGVWSEIVRLWSNLTSR